MIFRNWAGVDGVSVRLKRERRRFYLAWLVLSLAELASGAILSGCGPATPAHADSGTPSSLLSSAEPHSQSTSQEAPVPPLRISLTFFQGPLQAQLSYGDAAAPVESAIDWVKHPTTLPGPDPSQGLPLADFRDYTACAVLTDGQGVQLCFNVMGDVSNLGVNDREMTLEGVEQALCPPGPMAQAAPASYHLAQASRTSGRLSLSFAVNGPASACAPASVNLKFQTT